MCVCVCVCVCVCACVCDRVATAQVVTVRLQLMVGHGNGEVTSQLERQWKQREQEDRKAGEVMDGKEEARVKLVTL